MTVSWTVDPPEQGDCVPCGDDCCFDTTNWSSGEHTITITVTDYAIVNGEPWVDEDYEYAAQCVNNQPVAEWYWTASGKMVKTRQFTIVVP